MKKKIIVLLLLLQMSKLIIFSADSSICSGGDIRVYIRNETGSPVQNAQYQLINSANEIITTVSDSSGLVQFECLPEETYKLQPSNNLESYTNSNEEFLITVDSGNIKVLNLVLKNKEYRKIRFYQYDSLGLPIAGSEFAIYDNDGVFIESIVTNENGVAESNSLPRGIYYVKQSRAPDGFMLDEKLYEVDLSLSGTYEVDYISTGNRIKTNIEFNTILNNNSTHGLEFGLYDTEDNLLKKTKSKNNGNVIFSDVYPGLYNVKYLGKKLKPLTVEFEVTTDGKVVGPGVLYLSNLSKVSDTRLLATGRFPSLIFIALLLLLMLSLEKKWKK